MVMIFTLVSAVQEKLNEIVDQIKTRREEEKKQKEREAEEEEKVCKIMFSIKNFLFFLSVGFDAGAVLSCSGRGTSIKVDIIKI